MTDKPKPDEEKPKPREFATFLLEHNKGRTHDELSAKLAELVAAVTETGKAGSLTLTIGLKPQPKVAGAVVVSDKVAVKAPAGDRAESFFFVDTSNNSLVRNDPNQPALPFANQEQTQR